MFVCFVYDGTMSFLFVSVIPMYTIIVLSCMSLFCVGLLSHYPPIYSFRSHGRVWIFHDLFILFNFMFTMYLFNCYLWFLFNSYSTFLLCLWLLLLRGAFKPGNCCPVNCIYLSLAFKHNVFTLRYVPLRYSSDCLFCFVLYIFTL